MYALLPCLTIAFMQVCAFVPRYSVIALIVVGLVQWVSVQAAAFSPDYHLANRSEWLRPLQPDSTQYEEIAHAVRLMSKGSDHNNIVAIEEPWLNSNTLDFFAAKDRLIMGGRSFFVSLGYAQKDASAAFLRINEYHARYVITLAESFQNPSPNFINLTAMPVLKRIRQDHHFEEVPFSNRSGLVLFKVDRGPIPDSTFVPPAIAQSQVVKGGKAALDSINGSPASPDGSFVFVADGVASCDGWAFDDVRKSTPEGVWIELTQKQTGRHYYWHAQRYSRPALAESLKTPSVKNSGFRCDPVVYRLPIGPYAAQVYQIDGKSAIVNDFVAYTKSPRITVK